MPDTSALRRRWFQFSLRTLLIAMTLLAIAMGWFGWQARIVRHRQAVMSMIRERMRYPSDEAPEFDDVDVVQPSLPWYRNIIGDQWRARISIDSYAFSEEELRQIQGAFPESDIDYEGSLDARLWSDLVNKIEWETRRFGSLEKPPGIIKLPFLHLADGMADDKIFVTHLAAGQLYLFKTSLTVGRPREFRGYIFSTIPFNKLGTPHADGYIHIDAVALEPEPSDPKTGAAAIGVWTKRAKKDGWLSVSTSRGPLQ